MIDDMKRRAKANNFGVAKPPQNSVSKENANIIKENKDNRKAKKMENVYKNSKEEEKDK
jgi:hypothetical protein